MDISVVIVNYNTEQLLENCLRSLYDGGFKGAFEVFVVDNASSDGSLEMLKKAFPDVLVLANESNVGFSTAVNQALGIYKGRYALLLNPDSLILPHAIDSLLDFMESRKDVGAASPRQWLDPGKNFQTTVTVKPPTPVLLVTGIPLIKKHALKIFNDRYWKKDYELWTAIDPIEVETLSGACLMVRRETVEEIGPLDVNFFLFFEDVDWCVRIRKGGWKLYYVPKSEIVHFGMKSVQKVKDIPKISETSLNYYINKHWGRGTRFLWRFYSQIRFLGSEKLRGLRTKIACSFRRTKEEQHSAGKREGKVISFQWEHSPRAASYLLEVSHDPFFLYKAGAFVETVNYTLPDFLADSWPPGHYYWRVAPVYKERHLGEFCLPQTFELKRDG
jgi:GT2 family glycosyltransferase